MGQIIISRKPILTSVRQSYITLKIAITNPVIDNAFIGPQETASIVIEMQWQLRVGSP